MAAKINAMRDNLPKSFEYQGIVISSVKNAVHDQQNLVLLLKSESDYELDKIIIYGVVSNAFVPPQVENDFLKVEFAKNLERRYSTPLCFGDTIMWNEEDCDHTNRTVKAFRRDKPFYQVKSNSSGALLRIGGVIDPSKPATFWTRLRSVAMPVIESTKAEPDVFLFAWIRFETKMTCSTDPVDLTMEFDHFDSFEVSEQSKVCEAPWHRKSLESRFNVWKAEPDPAEDDYGIDIIEPKDVIKVENQWAETIRKQIGLYAGERLLLCKDLPQYDFILPLLTELAKCAATQTPIYPTNGEYFYFKAVWSNNHRAYLVTDMSPVLSVRGHQVTATGNLCVRVKPAKIRGFFEEDSDSLGLIDDPHHVATFLEFHPACLDHNFRVTVELYALRSHQNRSVRYRIARASKDDEQMGSFEDWRNKTEISIGPVHGMVINRDTVISAQHPNIFFRLTVAAGAEQPPPGAGIEFMAKRGVGFGAEAAITKWRIQPMFSAKKVSAYHGVRLFQIPVKPFAEHEQLALSEAVGPLDMRGFNHPNKSGAEYTVWVRESPMHGNCRRASTALEVCALTEMPPDIPLGDLGSSHLSSRIYTPRSGMSTAGNSEIGTGSCSSRASYNRFVGPSSTSSSMRHSGYSTPASSRK